MIDAEDSSEVGRSVSKSCRSNRNSADRRLFQSRASVSFRTPKIAGLWPIRSRPSSLIQPLFLALLIAPS